MHPSSRLKNLFILLAEPYLIMQLFIIRGLIHSIKTHLSSHIMKGWESLAIPYNIRSLFNKTVDGFSFLFTVSSILYLS
jgi:hypothetical protein